MSPRLHVCPRWLVVVPWWLAVFVWLGWISVLIVYYALMLGWLLVFWALRAGWRAWERHRAAASA